MPEHSVTLQELRKGLKLETGRRHVIRVRFPKLSNRLDVNPNDPVSHDDRFVLASNGPEGRSEVVRTIEDDAVPGDEYLDLDFGSLHPRRRYTLRAYRGETQEPHVVFEDLTVDDITTGRGVQPEQGTARKGG